MDRGFCPTIPQNFTQIRSVVLSKPVNRQHTNKQTDRQTDTGENITFLAEVRRKLAVQTESRVSVAGDNSLDVNRTDTVWFSTCDFLLRYQAKFGRSRSTGISIRWGPKSVDTLEHRPRVGGVVKSVKVFCHLLRVSHINCRLFNLL